VSSCGLLTVAVMAPLMTAAVRTTETAPEPRTTGRSRCVRPAWVEGLWPEVGSVTFHPTTQEEKKVFSQLVPAILEAAQLRVDPPEDLKSLAASAGFTLEPAGPSHDRLWILKEMTTLRRGAGAYVFRTGQATDDIVQAPHAYYDLGTGALAAALFSCAPEGRRPRVFATNTVHRYGARPDETLADRDHPADVAHNPEHLFQHVTEQLVRQLPALRVFQVHGFGKAELEAVSAIVSAGSRTVSRGARETAVRLVPVLGKGVRLYPEEIQRLGGTRNAQARLLQAYPESVFVHLELSADMRRMLRSQEQTRKMAAALFAPVGG